MKTTGPQFSLNLIVGIFSQRFLNILLSSTNCAGIQAKAGDESSGFGFESSFPLPLLVQLFLWFFVLPELLPKAAGTWLKQLPNAPFWTAAIGVGFFMSARVAVQLQAGISSLPRGQKMAATALGLTTVQGYRYVLLPLAFQVLG